MKKFPFVVFPFLAVIVGLFYMQSTFVSAHGDMREVFKGSVDGYGISVKTIPHELAVGQAHFTIEPTELESGKPIVEALVTLLVHLEKEAFKSRAVNSPSSPTMYDANLTFYQEGTWAAEVKIETIPGEESSVYFLLDVSGESIVSGTEAGWFFIFVFAVLVFGTVALIFRYKPKPGRVD